MNKLGVTKFRVTFLVVFSVLLVFAGIFYFRVRELNEEPPVLGVRSEILQGLQEKGGQGFLEYEDNDITAFESHKGLFDDAPVSLRKGINYVYTEEKLRVEDVIDCIDPKAERILFAHYNSGEKAFYTYPKGPFKQTKEADVDYEVPEGEGFIVISKKETEGYCFKSPEAKSSFSIENPLEEGKTGWVLIASDDEDIDEVIEPFFVKTEFVFKMTGPEKFEKVKNAGEDLSDYYLIWVKIGNHGSVSIFSGSDGDGIGDDEPGDGGIEEEAAGQAAFPGPPKKIQVTTDGMKATLTWEAPDNDGGKPVNFYIVDIKLPDGNLKEVTIGNVNIYEFEVNVADQGPYGASVKAGNQDGIGPAGDMVSFELSEGDEMHVAEGEVPPESAKAPAAPVGEQPAGESKNAMAVPVKDDTDGPVIKSLDANVSGINNADFGTVILSWYDNNNAGAVKWAFYFKPKTAASFAQIQVNPQMASSGSGALTLYACCEALNSSNSHHAVMISHFETLPNGEYILKVQPYSNSGPLMPATIEVTKSAS